MARANVRSTIVDESAVIPAQEGPSSFVLGYLDTKTYPNNILGSLGFTHEREQGYMRISSVGEWQERLKTNQPTGYEDFISSSLSQDVISYPFFHEDGKSYVAGNGYAGISFDRWPNGPVFDDYGFKFIENYLQYGGQVIIFSQKENENGNGYAIERAKNKKINIDAFVSSYYQYNSNVRNIVNSRQDCIAITAIPSEYKAGESFGPISSILDQPLEELYLSFPGSTVAYVNYNPVPSGTRKYVLDVPFLKNTGDNVLVSGDGGERLKQEPIFSVFFKNLIPNQSMFGTSADLIQWENNNSIDNFELAAGIRGCTFNVSNIIESGAFDVEPGITFFSTAVVANRSGGDGPVTRGIPYLYGTADLLGTPVPNQYINMESGAIVGLSSVYQQPVIDFVKSESGVAYKEIQHTRIEPGRIGVFFTAKEIYRWPWLTNSVINTVNPTERDDRSIFGSWLPANWRTNKFASTLSVFHNAGVFSTTDNYEILDGGYLTAYPYNLSQEHNSTNPGNAQKSHVSLIDVRDTLDESLSLLDEIYGPSGLAPDAEVYSFISSSSGFNDQLSKINSFKKSHNIYATADTFHEFDSRFWGCTCSQLPEFFSEYGLIGTTQGGGRGITPDICIEFGDASTTQSVTAEGSTYRAYIGISSTFPRVVITGPVNIYGEPIGLFTNQASNGVGTTLSNLIDKFRDLPFNNAIDFDFNEVGNTITIPAGTLKTVLFYPLITPDGWENEGLTHDTENYFYATVNTPQADNYYESGPIAPKLIQNDRNWPENLSKDYSNTFCLGYEPSSTNMQTQVVNVNPLGSVSGVTAINSVGYVGTPSDELISRFFGATANGISNDGIHMLARLDFIDAYPPLEGLLRLVPDGTPPIYIEDLEYNTLFASNADLYEFPVFGEKFSEDSFEQYKSLNETQEIGKSDEIAFTSDVAGMFARLFRDLSPWFSPANQKVSNVTDIIAERYHLSNTEQDDLYDTNINFIKQIDGALKLWGDKTFADSTSTFSRVNVANLFIYLKKKIEPLGRRFLFEQNDAQSRELFRNAVEPFLQTLRGQRAITDFKVICDETNNTPDIVDSNQFVAEILIKPTKTINYIRLTMTNVGTSFELE